MVKELMLRQLVLQTDHNQQRLQRFRHNVLRLWAPRDTRPDSHITLESATAEASPRGTAYAVDLPNTGHEMPQASTSSGLPTSPSHTGIMDLQSID